MRLTIAAASLAVTVAFCICLTSGQTSAPDSRPAADSARGGDSGKPLDWVGKARENAQREQLLKNIREISKGLEAYANNGPCPDYPSITEGPAASQPVTQNPASGPASTQAATQPVAHITDQEYEELIRRIFERVVSLKEKYPSLKGIKMPDQVNLGDWATLTLKFVQHHLDSAES